jgi:hypothetical protein
MESLCNDPNLDTRDTASEPVLRRLLIYEEEDEGTCAIWRRKEAIEENSVVDILVLER